MGNEVGEIPFLERTAPICEQGRITPRECYLDAKSGEQRDIQEQIRRVSIPKNLFRCFANLPILKIETMGIWQSCRHWA